MPQSQVRAGFHPWSSIDCGLAKNSPEGSLGLLLLAPAACSPAHLPKAPNSDFPRRFVLLKCSSAVPLVCTSHDVAKSFTAHS